MIFVTKISCKEQFKETCFWWFWKEEKFWIPLSNQKISLQKNLRMHSSEIHQVKKPLKCDICDHIFSQNGSLKRHMLPLVAYQSMMDIKHSNVNLWLQLFSSQCLEIICDHSFFSKKSNLKKHIGKVHEIKKHFTCNQNYLQKESSLKSYLKRHILLVHDEKTKLFKCSISEANFWLKSNKKDIFFQFMNFKKAT